MKIIKIIILLLTLASCREQINTKVHHPSQVYHYVIVDSSRFSIKQMVYVPVYSAIYFVSGSKKQQLTATLSIRNISFKDSFYVTQVNYYGSQGEILKRYIDSTLVVKPMQSIEFVVEQTENVGGAGANFVVEWGAIKSVNEPLIQAVMNSSSTSSVSFVTNGIVIK